jgi:hypothetical protein
MKPVDKVAAAERIQETATLELTAREWRIIIIALREAQTAPKMSKALADDIFELIGVQLD